MKENFAGKMIDAVAQDVYYKDEPQIWIFDRGFPSLSLIQKLLEHRLYFVMRVSSSFLKGESMRSAKASMSTA